jgi:hypothetical protein
VLGTLLLENTTGSGTANAIVTGKMVRESKSEDEIYAPRTKANHVAVVLDSAACEKHNTARTLPVSCVPYNLGDG